jgi:hypothetical protein
MLGGFDLLVGLQLSVARLGAQAPEMTKWFTPEFGEGIAKGKPKWNQAAYL